MANQFDKIGVLFVSQQVLQHEKWMIDQAIAAAMVQMKQHRGLNGFLTPSTVRLGDYALLMTRERISPAVATWIGIPGKLKSPIIQELFVVAGIG